MLGCGRQGYGGREGAQAALGDLSVSLEETLSLSGAIVVKSFGTEEREARRFDEVNARVRREQVAQLLVGQWLSVVLQTLATLVPPLLYTYGPYLVITHQLPPA